MRSYIEISIGKPLFEYEGGHFIYIRDKYLREAKKTGKPMRIKTPEGEALYTYEEWMKGAKRMEQVFKFPDHPLLLWGNYWVNGYGQPNMEEYDQSRQKLKRVWKNVEKKLSQKSLI